MLFVDETALREATHLLFEINNNPAHPMNDVRHPAHSRCVEAYERQLLLSKINTVLGCAGEPDYFDMTDNGGSYGKAI